MKKYIVSFLVVATFSVYIVYQRITGTDIVPIVAANPTPTTDVSSDTVVITTPSSTSDVIPTTSQTPQPALKATPTPTPTPKPTPKLTPKTTPIPTPTPVTNAGQYKNGQYTGISANAYYGNIQVEVTILGGKISAVQFLDYPQDRSNSLRINNEAMPILQQEAIQAQSANVNTVSGASDSSGAFRQSLASALAQAKNS